MTATLIDVVLDSETSGRFRVLEVDQDCPLKVFVQSSGLTFQTGRGFYALTGPENVPGHKAVIVRERKTGDYFAGARARELLGLPAAAAGPVSAEALERHAVFIQSTSANRKLAKGTLFLYQVADWGPREAASSLTAARDREALVRAVLADPDEDAPRLVCADWYEENGQAKRAEFVRLQVELGRLEQEARFDPLGRLPAGAEKLSKRIATILDSKAPGGRTWQSHWLGELPAALHPWANWRRGFVELDIEGDALDVFLAELARGECPPVTWRLRALPDKSRLKLLSGLARKSPSALPPLVEVDLGFSFCRDEALARLLEMPWLSHVSALRLGFTAITATSGRALAGCPFLSRLRVLSFDALHCDEGTSTRLGPEGLAALAASGHLSGVRELDLGQNPVRDEGLRALAASSTLTGVTWLNLFDAQVTDAGVTDLVDSSVVGQLCYLDLLGQNDLGDDTLRALAASPWLANLRALRLGGQGYSDSDYRRRGATWEEDPGLQSFTLDGWRQVCESDRLQRLSGLHLDVFEAGEQGAEIAALLQGRFGTGLLRDGWC